MNDKSDKLTEVEALTTKLLDGALDETEQTRLSELLEGAPEACEIYLNLITLHGHLQRELGGVLPASRPPVDGPSLRMTDATTQSPSARRWRLGPLMRYGIAAAVLLAITLGILWNLRPRGEAPAPIPDTSVATLIQTHNARWSDDAPRKEGQRLSSGALALTGGTAVIRFDSGATATLTGPAELSLESAKLASLKSGTVVVRAPNEAIGFTVRTAASDFVDLGTEFGVAVNPDHSSDIHVFEGVVIARPKASDLVVPVLRDETGRVEIERGDVTSIPSDPSRFPGAITSQTKVDASTAPAYTPLPPDSRIVFIGDRETDRETHLLLIRQAFERKLGVRHPLLFNAGISMRLSFDEPEYQRQITLLRPTHAVITFGPEIAVAPAPRSPEKFEAAVIRLLDRLAQDRIEPILTTGFPLGAKEAHQQGLVDAYNSILRKLATQRKLRLADVDKDFRNAGKSGGPALVVDSGAVPTFAGYRRMATRLIETLGYPGLPVDTTLELSLLPGAITNWKIRTWPTNQPLDAATVASLVPDASWMTLVLPQPEDSFLGRLADSSHSITYRDRARGFATDLRHPRSEMIQAIATIPGDREKEAWLSTGATLRQIWLNGEKVYDQQAWTGWHAGKERIGVRLKAGPNTIVIEALSSFFVGITDQPDWALR